MASNPVFDRIEREAEKGYAGFGTDPRAERQGGAASTAPAGWAVQDQLSSQQLQDLYNQPSASAVQTGRVTLDDVVMKTAGLFALLLVGAAVGWQLAPTAGGLILIGGIALTLVLGLVIAFRKTISVPLIVTYAAAEGLLVGSVSAIFNARYEGIVAQAVLATLAVFAGMLIAYKTGIIKVTERFRRIVIMAVMGYALFALVNVFFAIFGSSSFGIGGTGWLGIGISVFAVGLASVSLAVDFDSIDRAIAAGAPQKYSWLLAHGLIVTLVWLYLEILRLLARLRD